jgi:hypothetical protein
MSKNGVRSIGLCVLVFNLWLIGRYSLGPIATLVLTFGVAAAWELLLVRTAKDAFPFAVVGPVGLAVAGLGWLLATSTSTATSPPAAELAGTAPTEEANNYFTSRTITGSCPAGYVDHPADPKQCALPVVAERMLARARSAEERRTRRRLDD